MNMKMTSSPHYNNAIKGAVQTVLYNLDEKFIPFNWHDDSLGTPLPPMAPPLRMDYITEEFKDKGNSFEERTWGSGSYYY
jgi:hypothetical protein